MKTWIVAYLSTAVVFLVGDMVWLGLIAKNFYRDQLGDLMSPSPMLAPAVAFYLIYVVGVVYFAVMPALGTGSWTTALGSGALLGLCAYAAYDMSNLATLKSWPLAMSLVDLAWGTCLTALSATAGYLATRAFAG